MTQELNQGLLHCRRILYQLSYQRSPSLCHGPHHSGPLPNAFLTSWPLAQPEELAGQDSLAPIILRVRPMQPLPARLSRTRSSPPSAPRPLNPSLLLISSHGFLLPPVSSSNTTACHSRPCFPGSNLLPELHLPFLSFIHFHSLWFLQGFPGGASGKKKKNPPVSQCGRHKRLEFDPWVGKIPWKRAWQPTPVFFPGESPRTEEAWQATVHSVARSRTRPKRLSMHLARGFYKPALLQPLGLCSSCPLC